MYFLVSCFGILEESPPPPTLPLLPCHVGRVEPAKPHPHGATPKHGLQRQNHLCMALRCQQVTASSAVSPPNIFVKTIKHKVSVKKKQLHIIIYSLV